MAVTCLSKTPSTGAEMGATAMEAGHNEMGKYQMDGVVGDSVPNDAQTGIGGGGGATKDTGGINPCLERKLG